MALSELTDYSATILSIRFFSRDVMATSIQELNFQMVLDTILKPAGVKVGGFPEEMFLDLSQEDQERWACNIW